MEYSKQEEMTVLRFGGKKTGLHLGHPLSLSYLLALREVGSPKESLTRKITEGGLLPTPLKN